MRPSASAFSHRRLSVAMIVRDAADTLPSALSSVRDIADEIVVVDTGSTDRTREIALRGASRVFDFAWQDDFSAARNFCQQQLTGDFILWLDAGERLEAQSAQALREFVDQKAHPGHAYLAMVVTPPNRGQLSGEQVARLRLLPNRPELQFSGRVNEEVHGAVVALKMQVEYAPLTILRSAREHDPALKRAKAERNLRLATLEIAELGPEARILSVQGEALQTLGRSAEAARCFRQAIESSAAGSIEALEGFYGLLTTFGAGELEQQFAACAEALGQFPLDAQLLCAMASYLQRMGRLDLASRSFEMAARHGQIDPMLWHLSNLGEVAVSCQAVAQGLLGQVDAAVGTLEAAMKQFPHSERLWRQLLELYVQHDRRQPALALVDKRYADEAGREALRGAVRGACLAAKQEFGAAGRHLESAFAAGCRETICLRWLAAAHVAQGNWEAAERTLREWQSLDPDNPELLVQFRGYLATRRALEGEDSKSGGEPKPAEPGDFVWAASKRTEGTQVANAPRAAVGSETALEGGASEPKNRPEGVLFRVDGPCPRVPPTSRPLAGETALTLMPSQVALRKSI